MKRGRASITGSRPDVRNRPVREDVDGELAFHLEMRARELMEAGWDGAAAKEEARRVFGDVDEVRRECVDITRAGDRAVRRSRSAGSVVRDLKYAFRGLRRSPGFAVLAVLTLALGIGANSAIFSIVNGVLLRPLPYPESDRIVRLWEMTESGRTMNVPWANFADWEQQTRAFQSMVAFNAFSTTVLGGDQPVRTRIALVSSGIYDVFGTVPALGRPTTADDHREGANPVVVVSDGFWRAQLGADPDLASRRLQALGASAQVVGVMPPGLGFPDDTDVWVPMELFPQTPSRTAHNYRVAARLAPGATVDAARQDLDRVAADLARIHAGEIDAARGHVTTLQEEVAGPVRRPLMLLLGAAGLVLLVACSNLASTLLARGTHRRREMAVRASLGAGRSSIVRQLFTESLVLSVLGAVAGLVLAFGALRVLLALNPTAVPRLDTVRLDVWVVGFTLAVSVVTAVVFGLFPALRLSEADVSVALRSGARGSSTRQRRTAWRLLVSAEVALALVLLVGSGLLIRSFWTVLSVDPGFDAEGVLTVSVNVPASAYPEDPDLVGYYDALLSRMAASGPVTETGLMNVVPLGSSGANGLIEVEGQTEPGEGYYRVASAGYFRALGIPLLRGRLFQESDDASVPDVVLVNQAFADRTWPGQDPLGRRINAGGIDGYADPDRPVGPRGFPHNRMATVVGVVGDVRHRSLTGEPFPEFYFHYRQRPANARSAVLVLHTPGDPSALGPPTRALIRELDGRVPAVIATMEQRVGRSVADRRFTMALLGVFAAVALALSAVGIYGVVSYSVARRTREIGIRMALGAEPRAVRSAVLRDAMVMVVLGIGAGLVGAAALTRVLRNLLYEVSVTDVPTYVAVASVLAGVAFLASWIPVRRTTRIDPKITMQAE